MKEINSTNLGLYERALYLKRSVDGGIKFRVPLSWIFKFFSLDCIFPQKRVMNIELRLFPDKKILIKPSSDENEYALHILDISLDLMMVTFENNIRVMWYKALDEEKLIRSLTLEKEYHFTISNSTQTSYIGNLLTFSRTPRKIFFMFVTESDFLGQWTPRHVFKHFSLKSLALSKNGVPHHNSHKMSDMDFSNICSPDVTFWYKSFLACTNTKTLSLERFYKDMFIFSISLEPSPCHLLVDESSRSHFLGLVSSGTLELSLTFSEKPSTQLILIAQVFYDSTVAFNATGEQEEGDAI